MRIKKLPALLSALVLSYSPFVLANVEMRCVVSPSAEQCTFSGQGPNLITLINSALAQYPNNLTLNIAPGTYLLNPLTINGHNNITLHVSSGTTLVAPPYKSLAWKNQSAWITVSNATNFTLSGDDPDQNKIVSVLNGHGETWRSVPAISPDLIDFEKVNKITIHGIQLLNAPHFTVYTSLSSNLTVSNTNINVCNSLNVCQADIYTDGLHLNDTDHVNISNVYLATGDEGIAVGASRPISDVHVDHASFWYGHGFDLGSVLDGPLSNVTATNLDFHYSQNGLRIRGICINKDCSDTKSGSVSNVTMSNITMDHITNYPIIWEFQTGVSGTVSQTAITNMTYNNVTSTNSAKIAFASLKCRQPNVCTGITFNNVNLDTTSQCQGVDGGSYTQTVPCPFTH